MKGRGYVAVPAGINMTQEQFDKLVASAAKTKQNLATTGNIQGIKKESPVQPETSTSANNGSSSIGVGGFVYGSGNTAADRAYEANIKLWNSNPAARQAEIDRTLGVIKSLKANGKDVSAQEKHLYGTLKYTGPNNDTNPTNILAASQPANDLTSFKESQTNLIKDIYANQRASQLQKIKEVRDTQLQGLNKVNTQAEASATAQRGQIAAADIQASQRLRESMAQMGLLNSGDNLTAQGNLNTQRQSAMGQVNQELARVKQDVEERRTQINNAAANNDLALLQQLQAQQAQDMLALGYQVNDREYRDAVFGWQQQVDTAQLTGQFNGAPTFAAQAQQFAQDQQNWENRFNFGVATGTFANGQQTLQKAQQDWQNNFNQEQFDWQKAQQVWENTFQEKNFMQQMQEAAASRGLQWASLGQREKEFIADQAFREKQFTYQQSQDKIANNIAANKSVDYDYKTDPEFAADLQMVLTSPDKARKELKSSASTFINAYGFDGFQALINSLPKENENILK